MIRREFLKAAVAAVLAPWLGRQLAPVPAQSMPEPPSPQSLRYGQQWYFPLAFPAWFPVKPSVPVAQVHDVYLPFIPRVTD